MGNAVADRIANLAMKRLPTWMHDLADKMYKHSLSQDERPSKTLKYISDLNRERKCLELYRGAIPLTISELPVQNRNLMGEDAVKVYLQSTFSLPSVQFAEWCQSLPQSTWVPWPPGFTARVNLARRILCWAETLVWPSEIMNGLRVLAKLQRCGGWCPGSSSMWTSWSLRGCIFQFGFAVHLSLFSTWIISLMLRVWCLLISDQLWRSVQLSTQRAVARNRSFKKSFSHLMCRRGRRRFTGTVLQARWPGWLFDLFFFVWEKLLRRSLSTFVFHRIRRRCDKMLTKSHFFWRQGLQGHGATTWQTLQKLQDDLQTKICWVNINLEFGLSLTFYCTVQLGAFYFFQSHQYGPGWMNQRWIWATRAMYDSIIYDMWYV